MQKTLEGDLGLIYLFYISQISRSAAGRSYKFVLFIMLFLHAAFFQNFDSIRIRLAN